MLRLGIIGTGWVSDEYIRTFEGNPHTRVTALCRRDMGRAGAKAAQHQLKDCTAVRLAPDDGPGSVATLRAFEHLLFGAVATGMINAAGISAQ